MTSSLAQNDSLWTHPGVQHPAAPLDTAARWLATVTRYASTGGLITHAELTRQMRERWIANGLVHPSPDPVSMLARWRVAGSVLSIESPWGQLLPRFQFDPATAAAYPAMRPLLQLLRPAFDDEELALWFVTPNDWLGDQCPASAMHLRLSVVMMAARLDRHVACGNNATPLGATAHRRG